MSTDTITIDTPNGKSVVIRNYTTNGDDLQVDRILNAGMTVEITSDGEQRVTITGEATAASERKYVELLVQTIDGLPASLAALNELRTEDYAAVAKAVRTVVATSKPSSKA